MVSRKNAETEEIIYLAARKEYMKKGIDGVRMQQIADEAGINKALLHYYYKTKEDLFKAVFDREMSKLFELLGEIIQSEQHLFEKLECTVDVYYNFLEKNPYAVNFVIHAMNRNPKSLTRMLKSRGVNIQILIANYQTAKEKGEVPNVDFAQFFTSWIGLLVFPFMANPIITELIFEGKKTAFKNYIRERRVFLKQFLISLRSQSVKFPESKS